MIAIYDEMSHIKDVLAHGFTNETWRTDGKLLAMYYRDSGIKKSEALKKIKEKCERYCGGADGSYNKTSSYKTVNTFVNNVYRKDKEGNYKDQIRNITHVCISKDVVKWFLDLEENFILTDERVKELKVRRPGIVIKNNRPMNFNRIKYLFTIYVWTLIKEQYLEKPNIIYLNNNEDKKRFKDRADLQNNFNLSKERNLLFDLGFIDVNHGLGIIPLFKLNEKIFQENSEKPIDKSEKSDIIVLSGEDLYQCGYWLLKQRNRSFICQNCGKEFAYYSSTKQEKKRKYCKECASLVNGGFDKEKRRFCIDCGKEITKYIKKYNTKSIRCSACQLRHNEATKKIEGVSL